MGKFSGILLASDFDHTMTDFCDRLPERNLDAIRYFIREGGRFCIASGRSIPMLRGQIGTVPVNAPCITYNGAVCYDYDRDTMFFCRPLPEQAESLRSALLERFDGLHLEVQTQSTHYCYGPDEDRDEYLQKSGVPFVYDVPVPPGPWLKMAIYGKRRGDHYDPPGSVPSEELAIFDEIERFAKEFSAGWCSVTRSMQRVVEIWAAGCNKGSTARELAVRLGCPVLACIGDAPNDLGLLRAADFAFCPSDCDPRIAAEGFRKTVPCAQGAVAAAIGQLEHLL